MTHDFEQQVYDLLEATRLAEVALASGVPFASLEPSGDAYSRGPLHATFLVAQIGALRLDQINQARRAAGHEQMPFPRAELRERLSAGDGGRFDSAGDSIDFLEEFVDALLPDPAPVQALIDRHGLLAFQSLLRAGLEIGQMLVDADPGIASLSDLLETEASADVTDWLRLPGQDHEGS